MRLETYSYRYAEEILQHPNYAMAYNEVLEICRNCPIPVYEGKSAKQPKLNVVQQLMNTYFKVAFNSKGWQEEPYATPDTSEDALRSDFRKEFILPDDKKITVQIEVEFGNVASSYRNYFKFQLSYSYDMTDVCILIVPSQNLSTRIDSGVSNYEKTLREIPSAKLSVTVPTLVVGLFDQDEYGVEEMQWDVTSDCPNLEIVKGTKNKYYNDHLKLLSVYMKGKYTRM